MIKIKTACLFLLVIIASNAHADGTGSSTAGKGVIARTVSKYEVAEAFRKSKFGKAIKKSDKAAFEAQLRQAPCFRSELEHYVLYAQIIERDQLYIKKYGVENPHSNIVTQAMLAGMAALNFGLMIAATGYTADLSNVKKSGKLMAESGLVCLFVSIIVWIIGDNVGRRRAEKDYQNAMALREYLEKILEQRS